MNTAITNRPGVGHIVLVQRDVRKQGDAHILEQFFVDREVYRDLVDYYTRNHSALIVSHTWVESDDHQSAVTETAVWLSNPDRYLAEHRLKHPDGCAR